jgi:1,4-dihydroxy-2-naphthoate octaprenyltransferase
MRRFRAFLRLSRPEFLVGGLVFFWLGTRAADADLTWPHYLAGQGMVSSVQLFAQYVNEHFDQATDAVTTNRTWFSGGSGVLPAGRLHELTALRAAAVAGIAALGFGIWSATFDGRLAVFGLVGLVGSWLYSAPPARLIATGAGEAVASLIVTGLVPLTGALSRGAVDWTLLGALTFPLVLANLAMLLAVDAPDEVADESTGKRTLWVRLGSARAASVHGGVLLAVLAALLVLAPWRPAWSTGLALATTPLFAAQHYLVRYGRTGRRAYLLTLSAIGSLAALALGMGVGTLI